MNINAMPARFFACLMSTFVFAVLLYPFLARADTPAQTQKAIQAVCNCAAASYDRRDLSGFMALYAPNFTEKSVPGRKSNRLQLIAGAAIIFANNDEKPTSSCTVSQVVSQGNQAKAVLHWHHVTHSLRSALAYTVIRDFQAQTLWKKTAGGWLEASADVTRSIIDYRR